MESATNAPRTSAHRTVGIRDLRDGLSRYLDSVRDGAEITVTDHGRPVARIVPVGSDAYARLVADGSLVPAANANVTLPPRRDVGAISDLIER